MKLNMAQGESLMLGQVETPAPETCSRRKRQKSLKFTVAVIEDDYSFNR